MTIPLDLDYPEKRYRLTRRTDEVRTLTEFDAEMWERYMRRAYPSLSFRLEVETSDGWVAA